MSENLRARIERAVGMHLRPSLDCSPHPDETAIVDSVMAALERELAPLPDGRLARTQRDRLELAIMREKRDAGCTWREIAAALGLNSPQVAHARYQRLVTREADEARRFGDDPACSECGGRPRRGLIPSEDGATLQREGCYQDLAHGPVPAEQDTAQ